MSRREEGSGRRPPHCGGEERGGGAQRLWHQDPRVVRTRCVARAIRGAPHGDVHYTYEDERYASDDECGTLVAAIRSVALFYKSVFSTDDVGGFKATVVFELLLR